MNELFKFDKLKAYRKHVASQKKHKKLAAKKVLRENRQRAKGVHWSRLKKKIANLNYDKFLKSDYWNAVRLLILKRDCYKCTVCSSVDQLEVHHTTYKNHKNEHNNLQDLITLCSKCHYEAHCIMEVK